MSLDNHNPYHPQYQRTVAGATMPWEEKTLETHRRRDRFSSAASPYQIPKHVDKIPRNVQSRPDTLSDSTKCTSVSTSTDTSSWKGFWGGISDDLVGNFLYSRGERHPEKMAPSSAHINYSFRGQPGLETRERQVRFNKNVLCVLIPSREELRPLANDLWVDAESTREAIREAEKEVKEQLSSNESGLKLYSAMSLLYRPCLNPTKQKSQFRILIIDDSLVCRKLAMFTIAQGHRGCGSKDTLLFQQASTWRAAIDQISTRSYHVIIVDEILSSDCMERGESGHEVVRMIRAQNFDACVVIGMSALLADAERAPEIKQKFMSSGADWVWAKPLPPPQRAWAELSSFLPLEF